MEQDHFGRVGMVMATAMLCVALVGVEAYQTLLRKIIQGDTEEKEYTRAFYIRFAICGAIVSGLLSSIVFFLYGWQPSLIALGATVVAAEHLNIEVCRLLITEGRSTLSTLALALRTGVWAVLLPLLTLSGVIPGGWSEEFVLRWWLACSLAGLCCFAPELQKYATASISVGRYRPIIVGVLRASRVWVVITLSWRLLENGGRLAVAAILGEAQSGRFTLIATLASLSLVATKGILEPIYFSRILRAGGNKAMLEFRAATVTTVTVAAIGSWICLQLFNHFSENIQIGGEELLCFWALNAAFALMSLSQIWHFSLYRHKKDRELLLASIGAALICLFTVIPLGNSYQIVGVAASILLGALTLAGQKLCFSILNQRNLAKQV